MQRIQELFPMDVEQFRFVDEYIVQRAMVGAGGCDCTIIDACTEMLSQKCVTMSNYISIREEVAQEVRKKNSTDESQRSEVMKTLLIFGVGILLCGIIYQLVKETRKRQLSVDPE